MAGKPFLSRLKKRKKSYNVKQAEYNSQSAANGDMAGRYRSSSSSASAGGGKRAWYIYIKSTKFPILENLGEQ